MQPKSCRWDSNRYRDGKNQLRRQLVKAFDKEQRRANKQRLQFENEKA